MSAAVSPAADTPHRRETRRSGVPGVGVLARLVLRRDRLPMTYWVLATGLMAPGIAVSTRHLFPTPEALGAYASSMSANPGITAFYGPIHAVSLGGMTAWRSGFAFVVVALAAVLEMVRHTRADEDAGRRELVGAAAVSRPAPLLAATVTTGGACLVAGVLLASASVAVGLPLAGSVLFGGAVVLTGWLAIGLGGLAAQVASTSGGARGLALGTLAGFLLVRAAGDGTGAHWLGWLSPLGWAQRSAPYAQNHWWCLALLAGGAIVLIAAAFAASARRDVDAGVLPSRPGPRHAPRWLGSPVTLAWRLNRGLLVAWIVVAIVFGLVLGGVTRSVGGLLDGSPALKDAFVRLGGSTSLTDAFLHTTAIVAGLFAGFAAVQVVLRLRREETAGTTELTLALPVSRWAYAGGQLAVAVAGAIVMVVVAGIAGGLAAGSSEGLGQVVGRQVLACLVTLPAVWCCAAFALVAVGWWPRAAPVGWVLIGWSLFASELGAAFGLPQWLQEMTPYGHIPALPGGEVTALPLVLTTAIAVVLTAVGLVTYRRRDLPV